MSFSQKYEGKVLVPWYNSSEWRYVYNVLCNKNESEYSKALQILRVWKQRTPLLSAGVEGTLIILETITQKMEGLSDEQVVQLYSISLLRFLNLTAGNSERQGNFTQKVKKNDVPKWLIDIRHDIAHNNRLPSKTILELSMKECLKWTIEKYWKEQDKLICDYVVTQDIKVTELINMYCELSINLHYERSMNAYNEAFFHKINYMVTKRDKEAKIDFYNVLEILEEMIKQAMESVDSKNLYGDVVNILASQKTLFAFVKEENITNLENIPQSFKLIWTNIINILMEQGVLLMLAKKFNEITNDLLMSENIKKASSLWLKEIIQSLLKLKIVTRQNNNYSNSVIRNFISSLDEESYLDLNVQSLSTFDTKLFENFVLCSPNVYTLNYLYFLLYINNHAEGEVDSIMNLVESMVAEEYNAWEGGQVVDVHEMEELVEDYCKDLDKREGKIVKSKSEKIVQKDKCLKKWSVIENKSGFEGCPLGILPHQDRSRNPCFVFDIM